MFVLLPDTWGMGPPALTVSVFGGMDSKGSIEIDPPNIKPVVQLSFGILRTQYAPA